MCDKVCSNYWANGMDPTFDWAGSPVSIAQNFRRKGQNSSFLLIPVRVSYASAKLDL
ncbi:hypothetical protein IC582_008859 [Cucumis melo]